METLTIRLKDVAEQVVLDRRHLHQHPEIAFQEHETATFVAERLRALGIPVQTGVGRTGVVGLIRGGRPGKTLMLRADMDALPIEEETGLPFASQNRGVMHACGHDGHTAILLNAARVLNERRDRLAGTVKLCFQPAEEGLGGAKAMIADGLLENPKVDAAFGLHLVQWMPSGLISARPGPVMAAGCRVEIDIRGKGGHAALPHQCVDALLVASHVVVALQSIVARNVKPSDTAVVTMGTMHAGTASNVIAETVELRGTMRAFDQAVFDQLGRRIEEITTGTAHAFGAEAVVRLVPGVPPTVNDPGLAAMAGDVARRIVGAERTVEWEPTTGGEDFAHYLDHLPGCFAWVGTRNEAKGIVGDHHHPKFDVDETALPIGVDLMVAFAERYLAG